MASTAFRIRTLARVAGPLRRGFATSLAARKDTQGLKKLYNSADEAVADIPSGSTILSGGMRSASPLFSTLALCIDRKRPPITHSAFVLNTSVCIIQQDSVYAVQLILSFEPCQEDLKLKTSRASPTMPVSANTVSVLCSTLVRLAR